MLSGVQDKRVLDTYKGKLLVKEEMMNKLKWKTEVMEQQSVLVSVYCVMFWRACCCAPAQASFFGVLLVRFQTIAGSCQFRRRDGLENLFLTSYISICLRNVFLSHHSIHVYTHTTVWHACSFVSPSFSFFLSRFVRFFIDIVERDM